MLRLVQAHYQGYGPTLALKMLLERHGLRVPLETLRSWMREDGLWLTRAQPRVFHHSRPRRDHRRELIQIDGSEHRWFETRADPCTLLVFIDDATSRLMQLRFVTSESIGIYFETLRGYLETHGCPVAFYSDKHTVFRVSKPEAKGGQGMTQFGRALAELNIEIIRAHSSQAKGRVDRVNWTLQAGWVLKLSAASTLEQRLAQEVAMGRHYAQLDLAERRRITSLLEAKVPVAATACQLSRHRSTLSEALLAVVRGHPTAC